jgi:hypothetical protein
MSLHWRLCSLCIIVILLAGSCETTSSSQDSSTPAGPNASIPAAQIIHFVTFNIRKDAGNELPKVSLISHKTAEGVLKKQPGWNQQPYLTCYLFQEKLLIDSLRIEHPLYKHLEYPGDEGRMGSKDTVVSSADFTIRFQTEAVVSEVQITETLRTQTSHPLSTIKL